MALALPEDHFDQYFAGKPHWFGKLIHYVGAVDGTDLQGVGPHTDWNFLTLLLQDNTGGLQARPAGADCWIDVPPIDGALIVNIGEMLEVATDGYLMATPHRALPCAPGGTRDSIAFFWAPTMPTCSLSRERLTDHREAILFRTIVDVDLFATCSFQAGI